MKRKPMDDGERADVLAERLAGMKERAVARRHAVAPRTVRDLVKAARDHTSPEEMAVASGVLRARVVTHIDTWLLEAMQEISGNRQLAEMKSKDIARMMADLARVRHDVATAPVPGSGETPAARMAREQQPELKRESVEEWNARHAASGKTQ